MNAVSSTYRRLSASAALTARVDDRVYVGNYPAVDGGEDTRPTSPYVVISETVSVPASNLKGQPKADRSMLEIMIVSEDYRDLKEIRDIVRDEMNPVATEVSTGDTWEGEVRMYRETMDWSYWFPR